MSKRGRAILAAKVTEKLINISMTNIPAVLEGIQGTFGEERRSLVRVQRRNVLGAMTEMIFQR